MSLSTNPVFRAVLAAATLLPISYKPGLYADEPNNIQTTESKDAENEAKEKLREMALQNRYSPFITAFVRNPEKYIVDNKDVELALSEPNTFFALGIGQNPWTTHLIKEDANLRKRVQEYLIQNFNESFSKGLAMNINDYPIDDELIDACTENKESRTSYLFAQKKGFKVNDTHRQIVRTEHNLPFSQGVVRNPGYIKAGLTDVPQEDKKVCREHPKSDVAGVLSGLAIYKFEEADMEAALQSAQGLDALEIAGEKIDGDMSKFAGNIARKLNRTIKPNEIEVARANENSDFSQVVRNRYYLKGRSAESIQRDVDFAFQSIEETRQKFIEENDTPVCSIFAEDLFYNPELPISKKMLDMAMSEPYCYLSIAEIISQREDFPVTEAALKFAEKRPDSYFASGIRTNLAIKELRKAGAEIIEIINKSNLQGKFVDLAREEVASIDDKIIEEAHAQADTAEFINEATERFKTIKEGLNTLINTSPEVKKVTDKTFQKEVLESDLPVLVDFWAPWCGPCRRVAPTVKEIANEYKGRLKVVKVDIDDNPATREKYNIEAIPALLVFKGGKKVDSILGEVPKGTLSNLVEKYTEK